MRFLLMLTSTLLVTACSQPEFSAEPSGTAGPDGEATVQLPRGNELLAVHELSQRLIREGDIEDAATLLDLFLGIYQEEGSLVLQLGGRREAERDYLSEAKAREIPGVAELLEDSGKWWPLRSSDDPTAQGIMNLVGGAIAQELHAEQILGP